jgi:hypothetical protein
LRGEKRERDENPGGVPVYFYSLRGRRGSGIGMVAPSDPSPSFRITENFPGTALNSENPNERYCSNFAYKGWKQVQTKFETDLKEYQQMNINLVASLAEVTKEIQTEMTERMVKLMKNFDEVFIMLPKIITAEGLCVYCRAKQFNTKDKATQKGASEEHEIMFWTIYYDDQCRIHLSEKKGAEWFSQGKTVARSFGRHKGKGKVLVETWDLTLIRGKDDPHSQKTIST